MSTAARGDRVEALRASTVASLAEAARGSGASILIPTFCGRRGHPVVFLRPVWAELLAWPTTGEEVAR